MKHIVLPSALLILFSSLSSADDSNLRKASIDGNGPTGEVNGVRDPKTNALTAELKGPGCSNLKLIPMKPMYVEHDNGQG